MIERAANYERATTDYQIVTILQVPKSHFDPLKGTRSTPFLFTTGVSPGNAVTNGENSTTNCEYKKRVEIQVSLQTETSLNIRLKLASQKQLG